MQTPAYGFPVEPHALMPLAHWLPRPFRRLYWQVGVAGEWEEIALMRQSDLLGLFGPPVIAERVGPAVKSWIAVRIPPSPARRGAERPAAVAHGPGAG